ncbi:hypothetical protein C5F47_01245 [Nitrosopumilus cobalaminigenes]|uniref:Protein-disulfide isomerase n=1 Tax=Nitrosopumilus cobalaminigenes TaxID=1470066 RepID=A0A7D5LZM2_9ARCH|nr:hypothetical protein [Nitrosopumilus cobalaminigenes]QLH02291.1 hypothetical protein C5F47_01245 [Nitrosopumilus cobalaminigenes]
MTEKVLPKEDSDFSLPGRMDESNSAYFVPEIESKSKSKSLVIFGIAFVLVSTGIFAYYFLNQSEIDSEILDNSAFKTLEERMVEHYRVGQFGSDHAHAALLVFVNGDQIDFSHPRFQLQSKYIHFENNNPYLIHKHATDVPLDMLFSSFGLEITSECIVLRGQTDLNQNCIDSKNSMTVLINGKSFSNINLYEIIHNDRILISFGDSSLISNQLEQLDKLEIHDVPKSSKLVPEKDISV